MKRRLSQWILFTGIVSVSTLLAMILFERAATVVAETLLTPWVSICRVITPPSWQVQGNILLGMMWMVSGVIVYSMCIGVVGVASLAIMEKLRRPTKSLKAAYGRDQES